MLINYVINYVINYSYWSRFGRKAFCVSVTDPALSKGLDFNCKE